MKSKSSKQKATPKVASNARVNTKKITKRNKNKGKQVATRATRADFTEEDHALLTENTSRSMQSLTSLKTLCGANLVRR